MDVNVKPRIDVHEVRRMWLVMECKSPEGYLERVYMPLLHRNNKRQKVVKAVKRSAYRLNLILARVCAGFAAGVFTAAWAIPTAEEVRGYKAIGGEWLLIFMAAGLGVYIAGMIIKQKRGE